MSSRKWSLDELKYQEMEPHDIPNVAKLHNILFPVRYPEEFYDELLKNPHRHTILATLPSKDAGGYSIVGVLTYRIKKMRWSTQRITEWWNGFSRGSHAYIMTFGVAPALRRAGIGRLILQKAVDQLIACDVAQVSLHVQSVNQPAIKFYRRFGFQTLCILSGYYYLPDGTIEDAIWMRLSLDRKCHRSDSLPASDRSGVPPNSFNYVKSYNDSTSLLDSASEPSRRRNVNTTAESNSPNSSSFDGTLNHLNESDEILASNLRYGPFPGGFTFIPFMILLLLVLFITCMGSLLISKTVIAYKQGKFEPENIQLGFK